MGDAVLAVAAGPEQPRDGAGPGGGPQAARLSWEEAATVPVAYLTAAYGLEHLARLRGERVLIHAAAGGVGQAAVQLAQAAGAEVLATAHPSKWEFLGRWASGT